jgi:hypothetical protein
VEIPGIPDSIPRSRVVELVEALGLDIRDLRSFSVNRHAVQAEVFARNEQGHPYMDGEDIAIHRITIPIRDEADPTVVGWEFVERVRGYDGPGSV